MRDRGGLRPVEVPLGDELQARIDSNGRARGLTPAAAVRSLLLWALDAADAIEKHLEELEGLRSPDR